MIKHVSAIALVALTLCSSSAGRAQSPAGAVLLPPNAYRPPVALIVAAPDSASTLANSLSHEGLASANVTPESEGSDEHRIRRITDVLMTLRNDARFPTVIVIGQGPF